MNSFQISSIVVGLILAVLVGFGIGYAIWIYYHPIRRTYISVGIGTVTIAIANTAIIKLVQLIGNPWWIEQLYLTPSICLIAAGVPMAVAQEIKWQKIKRRNKGIVQVWSSEGEEIMEEPPMSRWFRLIRKWLGGLKPK